MIYCLIIAFVAAFFTAFHLLASAFVRGSQWDSVKPCKCGTCKEPAVFKIRFWTSPETGHSCRECVEFFVKGGSLEWINRIERIKPEPPFKPKK